MLLQLSVVFISVSNLLFILLFTFLFLLNVLKSYIVIKIIFVFFYLLDQFITRSVDPGILPPKSSTEMFSNDVWYRDAVFPTTTITVKPKDESFDFHFEFASDEEGCVFEYRLWMLSEEDLTFSEIVRFVFPLFVV